MPTTPTNASTAGELQALLAAIPHVNDGDVIVPEHHNGVRTALAQLAGALDPTQAAPVITTSFAPTLWPFYGAIAPEEVPIPPGPPGPVSSSSPDVTGTTATAPDVVALRPTEWQSSVGYAAPLGEAAAAWMPLQLPHGSSIDSLTIRGSRAASTFNVWNVGLYRVELAGFVWRGAGWAKVCEEGVPRFEAPDQRAAPHPPQPFVITWVPDVSGLTPAQAAELRRVDVTKYRYVFATNVSGASRPAAVQLRLVQVTCTRDGS